MREILPILWVIVVFVAVISSIVKSVRRQTPGPQAPQQQPPAPSAVQPVAAQRLVSLLNTLAQAPPPAPPQVAAAPKPVRRVAAARPVPPPADTTVPAFPMAVVAPPVHLRARHLFGQRHALVRAVIAAEVLGKPRALRDEW